MRLLSRLFTLGSQDRAEEGHVPGVLAGGAFNEAMEMERSRADRTGSPMAVVVAQYKEQAPQCCGNGVEKTLLKEVAEVLRGRLRRTDHVGWLAEDTLGVILAHTSVAAAQPVADCVRHTLKLRADVKKMAGEVYCTVYVYPQSQKPAADKSIVF